MLIYVRPSNEVLLRARVPGAQDQRGCPSNPLLLTTPPLLSEFAPQLFRNGGLLDLALHASNEGSMRPRVA